MLLLVVTDFVVLVALSRLFLACFALLVGQILKLLSSVFFNLVWILLVLVHTCLVMRSWLVLRLSSRRLTLFLALGVYWVRWRLASLVSHLLA